jgi:hypothetical protein
VAPGGAAAAALARARQAGPPVVPPRPAWRSGLTAWGAGRLPAWSGRAGRCRVSCSRIAIVAMPDVLVGGTDGVNRDLHGMISPPCSWDSSTPCSGPCSTPSPSAGRRTTTLSAGRAPDPDCPQPIPSPPGLALLPGQPGHPAALAPRACPSEMGALRSPGTAWSSWPEPRTSGADRQSGQENTQARQLAWLLPGRDGQGPLPAPRSSLQVHGRLRRGLPHRRRGSHPPAVPRAAGERIRREVDRDRQARASHHLLIFGRRHLDHVLREFVEHYHEARPHQGLGQRMPLRPDPGGALRSGPIVRRDRLGGIVHEYVREAA